MVSKIVTGSGIGGCLDYLMDEKKQFQVIKVKGMDGYDKAEAKEDFRWHSSFNPGLHQCVLHIPLAFHPDDRVKLETDPELKEKVIDRYIELMTAKGYKLNNTQYIAIEHHDTRHPHIHLVFNRVDNDSKTIKDSYIALNSKKVCQQISKEFGLVEAVKKTKDIHANRLRGKAAIKYEIYQILQQERGRNITHIQNRLAGRGIQLSFIKNENNRIVGAFYICERNGIEYKIKASSIDKDYTLQKIIYRQSFSDSYPQRKQKEDNLIESLVKLTLPSAYSFMPQSAGQVAEQWQDDIFELMTVGLKVFPALFQGVQIQNKGIHTTTTATLLPIATRDEMNEYNSMLRDETREILLQSIEGCINEKELKEKLSANNIIFHKKKVTETGAQGYSVYREGNLYDAEKNLSITPEKITGALEVQKTNTIAEFNQQLSKALEEKPSPQQFVEVCKKFNIQASLSLRHTVTGTAVPVTAEDDLEDIPEEKTVRAEYVFNDHRIGYSDIEEENKKKVGRLVNAKKHKPKEANPETVSSVNVILREVLSKAATPEDFIEQCKTKNIEVNFTAYNPVTKTGEEIEYRQSLELPAGIVMLTSFKYNNEFINRKDLTFENNKAFNLLFKAAGSNKEKLRAEAVLSVNDLLHEVLGKATTPEEFIEGCKTNNIEVNFTAYNPETKIKENIEYKEPLELPAGTVLLTSFKYNHEFINRKDLTVENNQLINSLFEQNTTKEKINIVTEFNRQLKSVLELNPSPQQFTEVCKKFNITASLSLYNTATDTETPVAAEDDLAGIPEEKEVRVNYIFNECKIENNDVDEENQQLIKRLFNQKKQQQEEKNKETILLINDLLNEILSKATTLEEFIEQCKIKDIEVNFSAYNPAKQSTEKVDFTQPLEMPAGAVLQAEFNYNNEIIGREDLSIENTKLINSLLEQNVTKEKAGIVTEFNRQLKNVLEENPSPQQFAELCKNFNITVNLSLYNTATGTETPVAAEDDLTNIPEEKEVRVNYIFNECKIENNDVDEENQQLIKRLFNQKKQQKEKNKETILLVNNLLNEILIKTTSSEKFIEQCKAKKIEVNFSIYNPATQIIEKIGLMDKSNDEKFIIN